MNDSLKDYPTIIKKAGRNGFATAASTAVPDSSTTELQAEIPDLTAVFSPLQPLAESDTEMVPRPKPAFIHMSVPK